MRYCMNTGAESSATTPTAMTRTTLPAITTITEWLAATDISADTLGLTAAGKAASKLISSFQLISAASIERETDKAIGVAGIRWNSCGNA